METLVISPDFTIEDIHKIREQNYEKTKDMTVAEKVAYYNNSGKEAEKEINRRRALKRKSITEDYTSAKVLTEVQTNGGVQAYKLYMAK